MIDIAEIDKANGIRYSIILSIESEDKIPTAPDSNWVITEEEQDYEGIDGLNHIKCLAILDQKEFDMFLEEYDFIFEAETLGSIGALGFGFCWTPALCFISENVDGYFNAYITPFVELLDPEVIDWDDLLRYVKEKYQ